MWLQMEVCSTLTHFHICLLILACSHWVAVGSVQVLLDATALDSPQASDTAGNVEGVDEKDRPRKGSPIGPATISYDPMASLSSPSDWPLSPSDWPLSHPPPFRRPTAGIWPQHTFPSIFQATGSPSPLHQTQSRFNTPGHSASPAHVNLSSVAPSDRPHDDEREGAKQAGGSKRSRPGALIASPTA